MINHEENTAREEVGRSEITVIPVIEEYAVIGKEIVETGKITISKRVTESDQFISEPILHEEVSVERVPVNQFVEAMPEIRYEGDLMIIPVVEQRAVVLKKLFVTEELRVRKQVIETHHTEEITLRKEEVDVKRSVLDENPDVER